MHARERQLTIDADADQRVAFVNEMQSHRVLGIKRDLVDQVKVFAVDVELPVLTQYQVNLFCILFHFISFLGGGGDKLESHEQ